MNSVNSIMPSGLGFFGRALVLPFVLLFLLAGAVGMAKAQQQINEGFDSVPNLPASGWVMQNNSMSIGTTGWFQGSQVHFPAQAGGPNSYIRADFNNTSGAGTIDNWLMTPPRALTSSGVLKFWTRTVAANPFPERLEIRMSLNGASTNVNDFTTLLAVINPNLQVGDYPEVWTEYTVYLNGAPSVCNDAVMQGRLAFRYFVPNAGPQGSSSALIGIDSVTLETFTPAAGSFFREVPLDYNCDGRTDYVVVRSAGGVDAQMTWFIHNGFTDRQVPWGISTDFFVSGDFDRDDRDDATVYRAGANGTSYFYTLRSTNGTLLARQFGSLGDDPTVVGDYDGDDIDDFAVYRGGASAGQPSFWYYRGSAGSGGITFVQYGQWGDDPAPGDYDGDGRTDFGLVKSQINNSSLTWSVLGRINNNIIHYAVPWGARTNAMPTPGDYDGDGKTDIAVWINSEDSQQNFFYVRRSIDGALQAFEWGQFNDYPVAFFNTH